MKTLPNVSSSTLTLRDLCLAGRTLLLICLLSCATPGAGPDPSLESQLEVFFQSKAQQGTRLAAASHEPLPREFQAFFRAGTQGDWPAMNRAYKKTAAHSHAF